MGGPCREPVFGGGGGGDCAQVKASPPGSLTCSVQFDDPRYRFRKQCCPSPRRSVLLLQLTSTTHHPSTTATKIFPSVRILSLEFVVVVVVVVGMRGIHQWRLCLTKFVSPFISPSLSSSSSSSSSSSWILASCSGTEFTSMNVQQLPPPPPKESERQDDDSLPFGGFGCNF